MIGIIQNFLPMNSKQSDKKKDNFNDKSYIIIDNDFSPVPFRNGTEEEVIFYLYELILL